MCFSGGEGLGAEVEGGEAQAPDQAQHQQRGETGQHRVAQCTHGGGEGGEAAGRAVTVAGIETHYPAVADDAHQAVGRQQNASLGQGHAKIGCVHRQQQVEQYVTGQAQAEHLGGIARVLVGAVGLHRCGSGRHDSLVTGVRGAG